MYLRTKYYKKKWEHVLCKEIIDKTVRMSMVAVHLEKMVLITYATCT